MLEIYKRLLKNTRNLIDIFLYTSFTAFLVFLDIAIIFHLINESSSSQSFILIPCFAIVLNYLSGICSQIFEGRFRALISENLLKLTSENILINNKYENQVLHFLQRELHSFTKFIKGNIELLFFIVKSSYLIALKHVFI